MATFHTIRSRYEFRWDVLDGIIGGRSSIDSPVGFPVLSADEADRFVSGYGFDLTNPIEAAELLGNYREALSFVRKNFLQPDNPQGLRLEVPRKLQEVTDIRDLLLMANDHLPGQAHDTQGTQLKLWACAILKIMHTVAHIDKDVRSAYFTDIQKQIFDRFYKVVHRDPDGALFLGDPSEGAGRVPLAAFETKPKKSRDSTLIKLLHKPENVAEDIFDRVGLRFVSPTRFDAIRVVKYLRDKMIILSPNIKPSRSRNSLINMEVFKDQAAQIMAKFDQSSGDVSEEQLRSEFEEAAAPALINPDNPHSSEFYRAIQFTGRHLIKLRNPLYEDLKELKATAKKGSFADPEFMRVVDRIDLKYLQREIRFFYPFEVQIVDQKSHEENEKGRSAHSEYKKAQLQTAIKRVMGVLAG